MPPLVPDVVQNEQDRLDEHWLAHVYRPDEKQLTVRALVSGCFLGGVMSIANLYIGLKVGWSVGMALTSVILAFALFASLRGARLIKDDFTKLENNTVASAASAAGYFCAAGMVTAIPALYLTQNVVLSWAQTSIWIGSVSLVGVLMAVPMRRQMIDIDRLPFPSGIAAAETIRSMHDTAAEAVARARSLLVAAIVAGLFEIPYSVGAFGSWKNPITWTDTLRLPGTLAGQPLAAFGLKLNTSFLMYGLGAILGVRVGLSLGLGALVGFGVLAPWLAHHGIVVPGEAGIFRSFTAWSVWPGIIMIIVASLLSFGLRWRTIAAALGSVGRMVSAGVGRTRMADVEVPPSWFLWGLLAATALVAGSARLFFGIPIWEGVLAVLLAYVLSIVACRSMGETDIAPLGPLGKIAQFVYAGVSPGNYTTNLMTASVTAGAASHASDLLTDLKTGYLLGASPRRQFLAQVLGIFAGAIFCVPAYFILVPPERIGSSQFPAPAAIQWAAVADLLARGVSYEDRGAGEAVPASVQAVTIARRRPGMAVGDTLRIGAGKNAGDYAVTMMDRNTLVLDRPLPQGQPDGGSPTPAELVAPDGRSRGDTALRGGEQVRPALRFVKAPPVVRPGDYVRATVNGNDVYHRIAGVRGDLALLDHAFVASATPVPVLVSKMGLPPYALEVTLVCVLLGVVITLLELYGPHRLRLYLPSVSGIGIAMVVQCWDSLGLALGAVIAWIIARAWPRAAERYTISTASGIVAGASLVGLVITFATELLGWMTPP